MAIDIATREKFQFVIHKSRNDLKKFIAFVKQCKGMIGFNSIGFDYAVVHPFLVDPIYLEMDGHTLAKLIYKRSQVIIEQEKREWISPIVPQRDLFLVWHFNNKARSTSLKWLQICMCFKNVQDMPIHHTTKVTEDMIPLILEYNTNDVESTIEFYIRSKSRIILRKQLTEKYGVDMGNYSDNRIGEYIFLKGIADRTGQSVKSLKDKKGTFRKSIAVKDFLVPLDFSTKQFREMYELFLTKEITNTKKKKKEKYICALDGVTYEFGFGGLHGFREPGVYANIDSADVSSYYPNLSISLGLHPQHLGQTFCDTNKGLYEDRKTFPKKSAENAAYKLALNGVIGMTNAEWSPFFDRQMNMSVTLNGQFLLAMLCERITEGLAGRIIMANTDGIEVDVLNRPEFERICKEWQEEFNLALEFSKYQTLAARDVNNYIGILEDGKVKEKGVFEIEKELYKNQSMRIIPIAVHKYFVNGIPVEQTINECKDIGLFLIGKRAKTGSLRYRQVIGQDLKEEVLQKNVRYYISRSGGSILKITKETEKQKAKRMKSDISKSQLSLFEAAIDSTVEVLKVTNIHAGYRMTVFNKWVDKPFEEYGLEKRFYINEAQKLINSVTNYQTNVYDDGCQASSLLQEGNQFPGSEDGIRLCTESLQAA